MIRGHSVTTRDLKVQVGGRRARVRGTRCERDWQDWLPLALKREGTTRHRRPRELEKAGEQGSPRASRSS